MTTGANRVPRGLYVTLAASLLVTLLLAAVLFGSGSPLKPVRHTTFELESPVPVSSSASR